MPEIDDATYKEYLKEVSLMISDLANALETYVWDEEVAIVKRANEDLIKRAKDMSEGIDDVIYKLATGGL